MKEYYTHLTKLNKSKSDDSSVRMYIKKETTNIIEVDSESNLSQYSISIIRILILISNSKGKKMLEETLINYRVTISLIDSKTIKKEKF
jgi:hypothetical protein